MNEIAARLAAAIKKKGLSTRELGDRTGVPKSAIHRYAAGKTERIPVDRLERLASMLDVSTAYLLGWVDDASTTILPDNILPIVKRQIPIIGNIAAGEPIYAEEEFEGYATLDDDTHVDFALRVRGDSMDDAEIHNGDIVFIRQQPDVDDGQIAAVLIDDEATLKRVYHAKDHITLISANPKYGPMTFGKDSDVRILGLAIICQSRLI